MTDRTWTDREGPVERAVIAFFGTACGWTVNKNSARVHARGVSEGQGDLYIQAENLGLAFWFEVKAVGYRQSEKQDAFMRRCQATDTLYVLGGLAEAYDFCTYLGLGRRLPGTVQFHPKPWRPIGRLAAERAVPRSAGTLRLPRAGQTPAPSHHRPRWGPELN